jgi:glycosyltransferase involved in cell wall biosynthesis
MNILIINYEYPPIGGGASNASYFIANELTRLGYSVAVMTAAYMEKKGYSIENNIHVYRIPALRKYKDRSNIKEMASFIWNGFSEVRKIIREQQIQKAIIFFSIPSGILGPFIKKNFGVPYIISVRGGDVPGLEPGLGLVHKLVQPLRRKILKNALKIVANSKGIAAASQIADPFAVEVIPNGVNTEYFSPAKKNKKDDAVFQFLFVGRFQPQKNLFFLLENIAEFKKAIEEDFILNLVGDGPQKKELLNYATKLDLRDNIRVHGWLKKDELLKQYRINDCLINPSVYEGMPNVVLEAMACGLPVIASDIMGNNELVKDGYNGFLFPLHDGSAFQNVMKTIFENSEERKRMGTNSRDDVRRKFSWQSTAKQYEDILTQHV